MSLLEKINADVLAAKKQLAVLVDPDKQHESRLTCLAESAQTAGVDFFFVGGSFMTSSRFEKCIATIKENCGIPVIIFPGNTMQISPVADAILLLSLISGRNPELLIGRHVEAAPYIKEAGLEVIPTGYMLIDSGRPTTAHYMSHTAPIPSDKADIASFTAMAGEMLGLKMIYLDAGSGASVTVTPGLVAAVKMNISLPLIVGGGIRTPASARELCRAGADIIVIGTAIENDPALLPQLTAAIKRG